MQRLGSLLMTISVFAVTLCGQTPPALTVGGAAATLGYAASAPGFVGLMQINLTVPDAAPTGGAVPVVLTIGTAQSPSGVTIAIK
jgi:uncharacterized protein (TIGR03437 family)